ncbi:MAG: hypothetical protein ACXWC6_05785 [Ramlibacter sp.]
MLRRFLPALLLAAACGIAHAQPDDATPGRRNQKVERLVHEDAGSRIEEVRYGGQAESITVQPKAAVPEYQVEPVNLARNRPADDRRGLSAAGGTRYWNVFKF